MNFQGFTIQWGQYNVTSNYDSGTQTFSFPRSFSAFYNINVFDGSNNALDSWINSFQVTTASTSTFTVRKGYSETAKVYMIAIGIS